MTTLLVTGGAGFIGSNFILALRRWRPEWRIRNLDLLTYAGNRDGLPEDARCTFLHGDVADPAVVKEALRGVDAVVHFAAESHVDRSLTDPAPFIRTNLQGTQMLLDGARRAGVQRFVQISTDEVYGSAGPDERFDEGAQLCPNNPYAASKAGADLLVRAAAQSGGLDVVITRCSNNYGPRQHPEKLIPRMIARALQGKELPLFGDGLHRRDWIHVEDHCAGVLAALERGVAGEIYNLAAGAERSNRELVGDLLTLLDRPDAVVALVRDRPGHDRRYAMRSDKAARALGWAPRWGLAEGLPATVRWYLEHEAWWAGRAS